MTITLDSVPAKLNELDLRAPLEVFEAIEAAIRERADLWSKWQAERCFLAKAEAELAALKARIADAPARGGLTMEWQPISTAPHEQLVLLFCPHRHPSNPQRIEVGAATWGERVGQRSNRGAHAWATHWMPLPPPPIRKE